MRARRRTYFSLRRQRRVGKRKATPLAVSLRCAAGSLRCSRLGRCCGTRCVRCALFAQTAAASQSTKHGHALLPMPAPRPALLGTARGVVNIHTGHRCARPQEQRNPGPSAAMARTGFPPPGGCACGAGLAGWRVQRRMHALRGLTRGGCLSEESAANAASSTAHPASAVTQVGPEAKRRGRRRGGRFLWFLSLAKQRKGLRRRAHIPASERVQSQPRSKQRRTTPTSAAPHPHPLPKGAREQGRAEMLRNLP